MPANRWPLNREGIRAWSLNEAKVAPTPGRAENAGALRRLAAASYTARPYGQLVADDDETVRKTHTGVPEQRVGNAYGLLVVPALRSSSA